MYGTMEAVLAPEQTLEARDQLPIKKFTINSLFGDRTVDISFDSPTMILIADNGAGKTTVLNMVYSVLSRRFSRLAKYEFENIVLETGSGDEICITADMIDVDPLPRTTRFLESLLTLDESRLSKSLINKRNHIINYDKIILTVNKIQESILTNFPYTSLYFPTYRRIEEDMENLGYTRKDKARSEGLIQFGMNDVAEREKAITSKIQKSSIEWYSRMSGEMLSRLVDETITNGEIPGTIRDMEALKIALDRVGGYISAGRKQRITQLVESGDISKPQFRTLVDFLANLMKVYDQQKEDDAAIKKYAGVCNKYLVEKEVVYDESSLDIRVVNTSNGKKVDLSKLSSGEKQIISLFSRLYLERDGQLAILFDEPELSLSIEWQKMLLPDILESGRCAFLLATTHSPFIFDNNLDSHARDLAEFTRRKQ